MKTLKTILLLLASIFTLLSCQKETLKGSGYVIEQQRTVSTFSKINCSGVFDVYISQGETVSVTVVSDDNLMDIIESYTTGNTLYLEIEEDINLKKVTRMDIYVTVNDLLKLDFSGVGDIDATNLNLEDFDLDFSGVGDLKLSGSADNFYISHQGVGDIKAYDFVSKNVDIENSSVGQIEVTAIETIAIITSGVGNVRYKGDPIVTELEATGTGKVVKVD